MGGFQIVPYETCDRFFFLCDHLVHEAFWLTQNWSKVCRNLEDGPRFVSLELCWFPRFVPLESLTLGPMPSCLIAHLPCRAADPD